jgi:hypothetical protein
MTRQRGLLGPRQLGYLSYDARAADLLGRQPAFSEWPTIFPNAGSAIALI